MDERHPVPFEHRLGNDIVIADGAATPDERYERREALELSFVAAFQHLSGRQRAVLLLREALGFSAKEVSQMLGSSVASTNSALQRARRRLDEGRPARDQQGTLRSLGDARLQGVVERLVAALERGDVDSILGLLADDATLRGPRAPTRHDQRGTGRRSAPGGATRSPPGSRRLTRVPRLSSAPPRSR